jgi:hypothetical protein
MPSPAKPCLHTVQAPVKACGYVQVRRAGHAAATCPTWQGTTAGLLTILVIAVLIEALHVVAMCAVLHLRCNSSDTCVSLQALVAQLYAKLSSSALILLPHTVLAPATIHPTQHSVANFYVL